MKKFKVCGEYKVRFEKEIETESLEDAWKIADNMDETVIDYDEEYDWFGFEVKDVTEVSSNDEQP